MSGGAVSLGGGVIRDQIKPGSADVDMFWAGNKMFSGWLNANIGTVEEIGTYLHEFLSMYMYNTCSMYMQCWCLTIKFILCMHIV